MLAWAGRAAGGDLTPDDAASWRALVQEVESWTPVALPVRGADALALGVPAARASARWIKDVEAWWEAGDYRADRAACLKKLKQLVTGR